MTGESKEWFQEWFDTEHYHRLYAHRDETEAEHFLRLLTERIGAPKGSHILDLACGRGRHARILSRLGYRVTGVDIAPRNIEYCRHHALPGSTFLQGDMRQLDFRESFDGVVLLFTSFGYFTDNENEEVVRRIHQALKAGGWFVLDYINSLLLQSCDIGVHSKVISGHRYDIKKYRTPTHICKEIVVDGKRRFTEHVRLYSAEDLKNLLKKTGFSLRETWGSYNLEAFNGGSSPRCILWLQKQA
jgi:SAM-dependent methyltransferase